MYCKAIGKKFDFRLDWDSFFQKWVNLLQKLRTTELVTFLNLLPTFCCRMQQKYYFIKFSVLETKVLRKFKLLNQIRMNSYFVGMYTDMGSPFWTPEWASHVCIFLFLSMN